MIYDFTRFFFSISKGYANYGPSLSASIKSSPDFGTSKDFVLDGIIDLEVPRTNWPTISFIDEAGKEALAIQIDPSSSCLSIKTSLM